MIDEADECDDGSYCGCFCHRKPEPTCSRCGKPQHETFCDRNIDRALHTKLNSAAQAGSPVTLTHYECARVLDELERKKGS